MGRRDGGLTILEPLVLLAIVGLVMGMLLIDCSGIQRGKQRRTMSDLRAIGMAVELYRDAHGHPPATLDGTVAPTFIRLLPSADGWGRPFTFTTQSGHYTIASNGKDLSPDSSLPRGVTTSFARDIYYSDGQPTQWPEGLEE